MKDKQGFTWLCTNNGVSRFNGNEFKNYTIQDGMSGHGAYTGGVDEAGRVWFITFNNKACYYQNNRIHRFHSNYDVTWIFFYKNNRYFLTRNGHLLHYKNERLYRDIPVTPSKLHTGIAVSEDTILTNSNIHGTFIVTGDKVTELPVKTRTGNYLRFYNLSAKGIIATCADSIYSYRNGNLLFIKRLNPGVRNEIFDVITDSQKIWICTAAGLFLCDHSTFPYFPIEKLNVRFICSAVKDENGSLWFSTLADGIYNVSTFSYPSIIIPNTKGNIVKTISAYDSANIFLFYQNGDIAGLTLKEGKYQYRKLHSLNDQVSQVVKSFPGFYIKTNDNIVFIDKTIVRHYSSPYAIHQGTDSSYYYADILETFKVKNRVKERLKLDLTPAEYSAASRQININPRIAAFVGDTMWFGNENGIRRRTSHLITKPFREPIADCYIADIKAGRDGKVWVATKGCGIYFIKNNSVHIPRSLEKLSTLNCNALFWEDDRNIWVAANEGLYKLSYRDSSLTVINYSTRVLLPTREVLNVCVVEHNVLVVTHCGVNIFKDNAIQDTMPKPAVYITNMAVDNIDTIPVNNFSLRHNQNSIRIDYTALDYTYLAKPDFTYCLKYNDYDSTWVSTKESSVSFSHLPPGEYTFYVAAQNMNGDRSPAAASIAFNIRPPFWKTIWFYFICIVAVLGLLALWFYNYQKTNNRKRKYIQSELTALRTQMNPHFIFNTLNSLQDFILQNDVQGANVYLVKFATLMRTILEHSKTNEISLQNEIGFLELYLELEALRLKYGFTHQININNKIDPATTLIPSMVLQPIIENAIHHGLAPKNSKGNIHIQIDPDSQGNIVCVISDNGVGRNNHKIRTHTATGIENTVSRLNLLNSIMENSLVITDLKDENGEALGTVVTIIMKVKKLIQHN